MNILPFCLFHGSFVTSPHTKTYAVGGLEHLDYSSIQLGIPSSQLSNSYFPKGWGSTTNQIDTIYIYIYILEPYNAPTKTYVFGGQHRSSND